MAQISVAQEAGRANERFPVTATIRNTSKREQKLLVWERSFLSEWLVDNPDVYVDRVNCQQDTHITIKLRLGEVYKASVS